MKLIDLKNKTYLESTRLKSKEFIKIKLSKFSDGDLNIEIIGKIKEIRTKNSYGIELFAKAWNGEKQLGFGKDGSVEIERFRFFNPPILVDDDNGDIITENESVDGKNTVRKLKYNPEKSFEAMILRTIKQVGKEDTNIIKGKIGNTTSTIYSYIGGDIMVQANGSNFSTLVSQSTGDGKSLITNDSTKIGLGSYMGTWSFYRRFITFDTDVVGANTIDSAVITIASFTASTQSEDANAFFACVNDTRSTKTSVALADYSEMGTTRWAPDIDFADWTAIGDNEFELNEAGIEAIDKDGYTGFGFRCGADINDASTEWLDCQVYTSYEAGTSLDPVLVIEHSAGASTNDFFQLF